MNKLYLDYQRSFKPFPYAGAALLAGAMAISVLAVNYYQDLAASISEMEASLSMFERVSGSRIHDANPGGQGGAQDIRQANEVLHRITMPWENLFQALESSTDPEVTFLGMEPDIEKHIVDISCEARNIKAMLNFVKRLKERREFSSVYLHSHRVQENDPQKPVRFSLVATWREAV